MLARRLPGVLPAMDEDEAVDTTKIYSVAGLLDGRRGLVRQRPFRAPHHTVSDVALVGGGSIPRPGEISLAHNGVLFLDEMPEFHRHVLEVLRQPLEARRVTIARSAFSVDFPADFMLIGALNPCPCGHLGDPRHPCTCTGPQVERYRGRLSGPLLDRIDLQLEVPAIPIEKLRGRASGEPSAAVQERVEVARGRQLRRFAGTGTRVNARMGVRDLEEHAALGEAETRFLEHAADKLGLSARAFHGVIKVARTIADLDGHDQIAVPHLAEAVGYRTKEHGDP